MIPLRRPSFRPQLPKTDKTTLRIVAKVKLRDKKIMKVVDSLRESTTFPSACFLLDRLAFPIWGDTLKRHHYLGIVSRGCGLLFP